MDPLLKARLASGLTRKQAASLLGINVARLLNWETFGCPRKDWESKAIEILRFWKQNNQE